MNSHGFAATTSGDRYIQQRTKYWSHRMATSHADGVGLVPFADGVHATFTAQAGGIALALVTPSTRDDARLRQTIERHLDRFAFREGALTYHLETEA